MVPISAQDATWSDVHHLMAVFVVLGYFDLLKII